jgi:hypothetical protein
MCNGRPPGVNKMEIYDNWCIFCGISDLCVVGF